MKIKILYLLILITLNINSQTFRGIVIDEYKKPISNTSIINLNQNNFTYSDKNGAFEIKYNLNDTIEINHLNYKVRKIFNSNLDTISLHKNINHLDEIFISSKKSKKIIFENKKNNVLLNISSDRDFAFKINNKYKKKSLLKEISIPIKLKINKPTLKGQFLIQFRDITSEGEIGEIISSENIYYDIEPNLSKKLLKIKVKNDILLPKNDFFIIIRRTIRKNDLEEYNNIINVKTNPYLRIDKNGNLGDNYFNLRNEDKWIKSSVQNTGFIPKLAIKIEAVEIKN